MIEISCKKELNGGGGKFMLEAELAFENGEFVALYGASGGGKTTILRLIAGFETPQSGFIKVGDKIFFDEKRNLAPQKRNIGFLFQDYALFENMNVFKNLLFAKDSAKLQNDDALLFLKRIAMVIAKLPPDVVANVIGHTDSEQPASTEFKDNWQLSSARAISVVSELIKDGVDPKKLTASAKAEFEPFATNFTEQGREKNRRVEIHFVSLKLDDKAKTQKSILDAQE